MLCFWEISTSRSSIFPINCCSHLSRRKNPRKHFPDALRQKSFIQSSIRESFFGKFWEHLFWLPSAQYLGFFTKILAIIRLEIQEKPRSVQETQNVSLGNKSGISLYFSFRLQIIVKLNFNNRVILSGIGWIKFTVFSDSLSPLLFKGEYQKANVIMELKHIFQNYNYVVWFLFSMFFNLFCFHSSSIRSCWGSRKKSNFELARMITKILHPLRVKIFLISHHDRKNYAKFFAWFAKISANHENWRKTLDKRTRILRTRFHQIYWPNC